MSASSKRLAIFDLGKTNAKMILRDPECGTTLASFSTPNSVTSDGPYPHYDIEGLKAFVLKSLTEFTAHGPIDTIMVSTHGAGIACMAGDDLVLPVMDYEFEGVEETAAAYDAIRPDIAVTGSYRMPRGLHLAAPTALACADPTRGDQSGRPLVVLAAILDALAVGCCRQRNCLCGVSHRSVGF